MQVSTIHLGRGPGISLCNPR